MLLIVLVSSGQVSWGEPVKETGPLTAKRLEAVWADFLLIDDAGTRKAQQGISLLAGAPDLAVPFIRERVKLVPVPDTKRLGLLITDLDSSDFRTREVATRELEKLGPLAAPALEKKLTEKLGLETERRVESILGHVTRTVLTSQELRAVRAIRVLEAINTPEAVAVLQDLAKGADGAVETAEAQQALATLGRSPTSK
jgi:hypothetical protein